MSFLECIDLLGDHKAIGWGIFGAGVTMLLAVAWDWRRSRRGRS